MEQILTASELKTYNRNISTNISDDKLNQFILDAQRFDIEPILGKAFYYELYNGLASSPVDAKYTNVVDGTSYTDRNGYTVEFWGLKPVIAYFAIARLRSEAESFITRSGSKTKTRDQSERTGYKAIESQANDDRSKAVKYQDDLLVYLDLNRSTYPNWDLYSPKSERSSGFQIYSVDKSANAGTQNY